MKLSVFGFRAGRVETDPANGGRADGDCKASGGAEPSRCQGGPMSTRTRSGAAVPVRSALVLWVMSAGMFLVLLDITVVNVALPGIQTGLDTGITGAQWVVDGYVMALAGLLLTGGALGDRVGHRRLVLVGMGLFGTGSTVCGLAGTVGLLVAARILQGAGSALFLPASIALITQVYPEQRSQARALGVWAGISALALPAGPLLGGLAVSAVGWRWVFLINPPVVLAAATGTLLWAPDRRGTGRAGFGLAGAITAASIPAALICAVIAAGHQQLTMAGGAAAVALVAAIVFLVHESRTAQPLVPLSLFRRSAFIGANTAAPCMNAASNGTLFVTTIYLQQVRGYSALIAGCMLLAMFVPIAVVSPVAGRLTARYGPRRPMFAGAVVSGMGETGLLLVSPHSGYLALVPMMLGIGIGNGLFTVPVVTAAIRSAPGSRSGLASGITNTVRQTGTAVGVAVFGAIAGSPDDPNRFVAGLHALAILGGLLWLTALMLTIATVPADTPQ